MRGWRETRVISKVHHMKYKPEHVIYFVGFIIDMMHH